MTLGKFFGLEITPWMLLWLQLVSRIFFSESFRLKRGDRCLRMSSRTCFFNLDWGSRPSSEGFFHPPDRSHLACLRTTAAAISCCRVTFLITPNTSSRIQARLCVIMRLLISIHFQYLVETWFTLVASKIFPSRRQGEQSRFRLVNHRNQTGTTIRNPRPTSSV